MRAASPQSGYGKRTDRRYRGKRSGFKGALEERGRRPVFWIRTYVPGESFGQDAYSNLESPRSIGGVRTFRETRNDSMKKTGAVRPAG